MKFIRFEEIPPEQKWVKFKEFFFCKDKLEWTECVGNSYYIVNIDAIEMTICDFKSDLVTVCGLVGKFFI